VEVDHFLLEVHTEAALLPVAMVELVELVEVPLVQDQTLVITLHLVHFWHPDSSNLSSIKCLSTLNFPFSMNVILTYVYHPLSDVGSFLKEY
jgi:hypothetical protein